MEGQDEFFEELRREYLTEAPARLAELRKDLAAVRSGEAGAAASLKGRLHRLAGSGGSYGFPEISRVSREAERWLGANPSPALDALEPLETSIAAIARSFDQAAAELGLPVAPPHRSVFGWQAVAVGSAGGQLDRIAATLDAAQYSVRRLPASVDPAGIPISERADIAVLAPLDDTELAQVVERWARPGPGRPGTVVLVAAAGAADPLALPFAHLDLILPPDRLEPELLRFSQSLGRAKTAPRTVLVVTPDSGMSGLIGAALESTGVRLVPCDSGAALRTAFKSSVPDLIVTSWTLPDTTGAAVVRWVRQMPEHRLIPIAVLAGDLGEADRIAAERAGTDLILDRTASRSELTQTLLARIERGLLARCLTHRDELTGLIGHPTMVEELEHAVAQSRRSGEPLAYLAIDLDHFRRINERHGAAAGDVALIHLARVVSGTVRAGDFVARMGGEELGVLIRRCSAENAVKVGEKIRGALEREPASVGLETIPLRVSIGIATYPEHGTSGQDIVRTADRALIRAKQAGRDRVMVG
jgi:diguanylate cyclase (GGDEF)-like protein